jgi:hypothetical protein
MAIVQIDQPSQLYVPVFNKVLFRVLSDKVLEPGFKYAIKIRNLNTDTIIATSYYPPSFDPAQPVEIDVSYFLQSYFDYYRGLLYTPTPSWLRTQDMSIVFRIEFYEYYDINLDGLYEIDNSSLINSENFIGLPFVFSPYERYFLDDVSITNDFFDYRPFTNWQNISLSRTKSYFNFLFYDYLKAGGYFGTTLIEIGGVNVRYYSNTNTLLSTVSYPLSTIPLNEFDLGAYFHFNLSQAPSNAVKAELEVFWDFLSTTYSNTFATVNILDCIRPTGKTLYYLNRFGAYDTFVFPLNSFTYKDVNRQQYKRFISDYGYTNDTGIWRHRNSSPVYYSRTSTRMMVQSDWLTDEQSKCLEELFNSSSVYMLDEQDGLTNDFTRNRIEQPPKLIPVTITEKQYEVKYTRAHRLFQYNVQIEFAEKENRHSL